MTDTIAQFRDISWNNTRFQILSRSTAELLISFERVSLAGEEPKEREIAFFRPSNEWASLWDVSTNEWLDHPDSKNPIGTRIEQVAVKEVGKLKFSFGGHHRLGWSRWGFTADSFRINP